jgi:hypothetical protein
VIDDFAKRHLRCSYNGDRIVRHDIDCKHRDEHEQRPSEATRVCSGTDCYCDDLKPGENCRNWSAVEQRPAEATSNMTVTGPVLAAATRHVLASDDRRNDAPLSCGHGVEHAITETSCTECQAVVDPRRLDAQPEMATLESVAQAYEQGRIAGLVEAGRDPRRPEAWRLARVQVLDHDMAWDSGASVERDEAEARVRALWASLDGWCPCRYADGLERVVAAVRGDDQRRERAKP